jgi:hypothetical protein
MNLQYSVPKPMNRSIFLLMAIVVVMVSLFLFVQQISPALQPWLKSPTHPAEVNPTIPANQPISLVMPVPEPHYNQGVQSLQARTTPVPAVTQPQPVPQPVATPPAGN